MGACPAMVLGKPVTWWSSACRPPRPGSPPAACRPNRLGAPGARRGWCHASDQHQATGAPSPLLQADGDRVEACAPVGWIVAGHRRGVEDPCAVRCMRES